VCGALAGLKEGSWARGRASWPRNPATCAGAHAPVHGGRGEGRSNREGPWRRESKGDARGNGSALVNRARATKRGCARVGTVADRRGPPVRRHGCAAWLGLVGCLGPNYLFLFFLEFLIPFLFIFPRIFNSNSN
jgi:hypothetical protein